MVSPRMGSEDKHVSERAIKGNYPVKKKKAACKRTVQFTGWREIDSLRSGDGR